MIKENHELLRDLRKEGGFSQEEFADRHKISVHSLVNYEKGHREIPIKLIRSIIKKEKVKPDYFFQSIEKGRILASSPEEQILILEGEEMSAVRDLAQTLLNSSKRLEIHAADLSREIQSFMDFLIETREKNLRPRSILKEDAR